MEDVIVDLHEIWWHVKHLLALHVDILENLLLIRLARRKDFAVRPELETDWELMFYIMRTSDNQVMLLFHFRAPVGTPGV